MCSRCVGGSGGGDVSQRRPEGWRDERRQSAFALVETDKTQSVCCEGRQGVGLGDLGKKEGDEGRQGGIRRQGGIGRREETREGREE